MNTPNRSMIVSALAAAAGVLMLTTASQATIIQSASYSGNNYGQPASNIIDGARANALKEFIG